MACLALLLIFISLVKNSLTIHYNFPKELIDLKSLITFDVYTTENRNTSIRFQVDEESIIRSGLNLEKSITLAIHGLWGHYDSEELRTIKNAKLDLLTGNVITIDYSALIDVKNLSNITTVVAPLAATTIVDLLTLLYERFDFDINRLHVVGFSLGAQIAGLVGHIMQNVTSLNLSHITALDPLGSAFYNTSMPLDMRLSANDAHYVEVIHTNTADWGFMEPMGHADYYINGGLIQPGCNVNNTNNNTYEIHLCSHKRSYHLVHDMWLPQTDHEFIAMKCFSYNLLDPNGCHWLNVQMGAYQPSLTSQSSKPLGIFYVETNDHKPFGKGAFKIEYW